MKAVGLVASLVLAVQLVARAEIVDRVLAVANGELILLSDVTAARDLGLVRLDESADPIGDLLARLIDRKLILTEVDRYAPPEPGADAVDREVANVQTRFSSQRAFEAVLAQSGIDENHLRQTLRENLRIRAYEDQRFAVPPPTEEEIGLYYREHPAQFSHAGRLMPFETARGDVLQAIVDERRKALTVDWIIGLRRRADLIDLHLPGR